MGLYDFTDPSQEEDDNPRKLALSLGLLDNPDEGQSDPQRFSQALGLTDSELSHQGKLPENYLDDNLGSVTRSLPIDQPSGSIVSGGREDLYHKYSQMLEQKPEGDSLLSNYLGRMPTHAGFQPSGHDRAVAAVMGGISGLNKGGMAGISTSQQWLDKPFEESTQDWKGGLPLVELQAKQTNSEKQRQAAGILSMIRAQETERENRRKDDLTSYLRDTQRNNSTNRRDKNLADASRGDQNYQETVRHHKAIENKISGRGSSRAGSVGEKLSPYDKIGLREYERSSKKGTILDSLGFGEDSPSGNPDPFINPITGRPYTEEEIARMGTLTNSREFNK